MQLIFTKGSGKHDMMDVILNGVLAESIACPKQGIIPHDMVHYAVESTLHKRGFIGRILDGEATSFRMATESESDGVERLVEVFQADGWSGWSTLPQTCWTCIKSLVTLANASLWQYKLMTLRPCARESWS